MRNVPANYAAYHEVPGFLPDHERTSTRSSLIPLGNIVIAQGSHKYAISLDMYVTPPSPQTRTLHVIVCRFRHLTSGYPMNFPEPPPQ